MQKSGVSLLEMLIYIACCALIASLAGKFIVDVHKASKERVCSMDTWVSAVLALDRLVTDIKQAARVKKCTQGMIILHVKEYDCGWFVHNSRLVRVTGIYGTTGHWSHRAVAIVLDSIESLSFHCIKKKNKVVGIKISIFFKNGLTTRTVETFVALRASKGIL